MIATIERCTTGDNQGVRFGEIRAALRTITPRAMTLALKDLCRYSLAQRVVDADAYPPIARYRLEPKAMQVAELVGLLPNQLPEEPIRP